MNERMEWPFGGKIINCKGLEIDKERERARTRSGRNRQTSTRLG